MRRIIENYRAQLTRQLRRRRRGAMRRADRRMEIQQLEPRQLLAVEISEFMADNTATLFDEDGDFSDWIELHNDSDSPINLENYYLTNDSGNMTQWQLPATTVAADGYLLVFASEKDRAIAGGQLHTSFSLDESGGFLALVEPDGAAVASRFSNYPAMSADQSYGPLRAHADSQFVGDGVDVQVLIPTDNSLGATWTGGNEPFDDSTWLAGTSPVGFETSGSSAGFSVINVENRVYGVGTIGGLAQADAAINTVLNLPNPPTPVNFATVNFLGSAGDGHYGNNAPFPNQSINQDIDDFAIYATATIFVTSQQAGLWTFGFSGDDGARLRIDGITVFEDNTTHPPADFFGTINLTPGTHDLEFVFFERAGGAEVELFAAQGNYGSFNASVFNLVGANAPNALQTRGLSDTIATDLADEMQNVNASAYLRYAFDVDDPADVTNLALNLNYDDGFDVFLNGVHVGMGNAPAAPQYNSAAVEDLGFSEAFLDLSSYLGQLRSGDNTLAIQGLNASAADSEFFLQPQLSGRTLQPATPQLIDLPTPGGPNGIVDPVISEFLASNNNTLDDEDGDSSDWIEIHNPGTIDINLAGYYLTDDPNNLTRWQFPSTNLPAGEYLVVFASNKDRAVAGAELHTDFQLSAGGEYLALVKPDGVTIAFEYQPGGQDYPDQFEDISFGLANDGAVSDVVLPPLSVDGAGFTVRQVNASASFAGQVTGEVGGGADPLSDVDLLLSLPEGDAGIESEVAFKYDVINFRDSAGGGTNGLFGEDEPFPLDSFEDDDDNFALHVTANLEVATGKAGEYLIGFNSNEGGRLTIDGNDVIVDNARHFPSTQQVVLSLTEGTHSLEFVYFEHTDGSEVELFFAPVVESEIGDVQLLVKADPVPPTIANSSRLYFTTPTPGASNGVGVENFIGPTTFSVEHGFYTSSFQLEIHNDNQDAQIRYTLNGIEPTATSGSIYSAPLTINRTTTIRAAAFLPGADPSPVATSTYIFTTDVARQQKNATPSGFPTSWGSNTVNYGMDQSVVNNANWGPQMQAALTQIPSMSMVVNTNDLFNASSGIYANAGQHGRAWERPMSLELIYPEGYQDPYGDELDLDGFQIDAGMRIRGGFSRTASNPKHAFRFFFRQEYGEGKLNYALFGDEGADQFDKVDLRTSQNYSWGFQNSTQNNMIREIFSRDAQGTLGQPYTRGRYYHLYINGQYWGIFQTEERPEARFAASYFGGSPEDYDVVKNDPRDIAATDGNTEAYNRLADFFYQPGGLSDSNMDDYWKAQGMNPDGTRNADYERLLDVDNLIDYMIITYWTSDADGPGSEFTRPGINNYFAFYNRENPDGFKYMEHDSEHSLDTGNAAGANYNMVTPLVGNGGTYNRFNAHWMHEELANGNSVYRQRFIDRVTEVLADDGVLGVANAQRMLNERASQISTAIIAESARWGNSSNQSQQTWQSAVQTTLNWVAGSINNSDGSTPSGPRNRVVLDQLRAEGWYPSIAAPQIDPNGGQVTPGQSVSLSVPGGQANNAIIHYTLDGTDPLGPDVMPTSSAIAYNALAEFVTDQSTGKYLAPNGAPAETGWQNAGYNDSAWSDASAGIGFDTGTAEVVGGFAVRIVDTTSGDVADLAAAQRILNGNTAGFTIGADITREQPYVNHGAAGNLTSPPVLPFYATSDAEHFALRAVANVTIPVGTWTVDVGSDDGFSVTIPGATFSGGYGSAAISGNTFSYAAPRGHNHSGARFTVSGQPLQTTLTLDFYERGGGDSVELSIASGGLSAFSTASFRVLQDGQNNWSVRTAGENVDYSPYIDTDIENQLYNVGSTVYVRYPFSVSNAASLQTLSLGVQYDDGFIAYLNGVRVASRNAPANPAYNSTSTDSRSDFESVVSESINLSNFVGELNEGSNNVLAIQALNASATNPDLLMTVEMSGAYSGQPFTINDSTMVTARAFNEGEWSPISRAFFSVGDVDLTVTEINYNPDDPTPAELAIDSSFEGSDFEFIELRNTGQEGFSLAGVQMVQQDGEGIEFNFTTSNVARVEPGEYVLLVRNQAGFEARYGSGLNSRIAGVYSGGLSNGGELLTVIDGAGEIVTQFAYDDSGDWPGRADGNGSSLELIDVDGHPNDPLNWRSSVQYHGSPAADGVGAATTTVVVNEVLSHTDPPDYDSIELHNTTGAAIDITGWWLSDSRRYAKYQILEQTVIPAGGYVFFDELDFNPTPLDPGPNDFALSGKEGDDVFLMAGEVGNPTPTEFRDNVEFGAAFNGESWGRWPNATGNMFPMSSLTLGSANSGPRVGPLVISEIMYNPANPDGVGGIDADNLEFVEIYNPTSGHVDLSNWEIDGGISFAFDLGTTIAPNSSLVIVPFDPEDPRDAGLLDDFREEYGLDASVRLLGGYSNKLGNGGETVRLYRPDEPPLDRPNFTPLVLEDEVRYLDFDATDADPWPDADNNGNSINRMALAEWGNDPSNWLALPASPGSVITTHPQVASVLINAASSDPADLDKGVAPSQWTTQRSDIGSIVVVFSQAVLADDADFTLTNLGVNAAVDPDADVDLSGRVSVAGNLVTITFDAHQLEEGVYQLDVAGTVTDLEGNLLDGNGDGVRGDGFSYVGNASNSFHVLNGDFNADGGVTIFDFPTFAYWFGIGVPEAPSYVDLNDDGGVTIFDFPDFAARFGTAVRYAPAFAGGAISVGSDSLDGETAPVEQAEDHPLEERFAIDAAPRSDSQPQAAANRPSEAEQADDLESVLDEICGDVGRVWNG